jgi:hypothetical protein
MSLRIVDLGKTSLSLMRSATLIRAADSGSTLQSSWETSMVLPRGLPMLEQAVSLSLSRDDLAEHVFGRADGVLKYFP